MVLRLLVVLMIKMVRVIRPRLVLLMPNLTRRRRKVKEELATNKLTRKRNQLNQLRIINKIRNRYKLILLLQYNLAIMVGLRGVCILRLFQY